jgi:hypothetical protein
MYKQNHVKWQKPFRYCEHKKENFNLKNKGQKKIPIFFPPKMESREYSKVPRCHMQISSPFKPKLCTKSCMGAKSLPSGQSQQTKCAIFTQTISTRSNECFTRLHLYSNFLSFSVPFLHVCSMNQTNLSGLCFVSHLSPSSKTLAKIASWI